MSKLVCLHVFYWGSDFAIAAPASAGSRLGPEADKPNPAYDKLPSLASYHKFNTSKGGDSNGSNKAK